MENIKEITYNVAWKITDYGDTDQFKNIVTLDTIRGTHYVIQTKVEKSFAEYIVKLHNKQL